MERKEVDPTSVKARCFYLGQFINIYIMQVVTSYYKKKYSSATSPSSYMQHLKKTVKSVILGAIQLIFSATLTVFEITFVTCQTFGWSWLVLKFSRPNGLTKELFALLDWLQFRKSNP